jgi:hypothetical protein
MKSSGSSHERHSLAFAGRAAHARRVRLFSDGFSADPAVASAGRRPNVLIVLIDDAGFGASSTFGGHARRHLRSGWPRAD